MLFSESDIGENKARVLASRLTAIAGTSLGQITITAVPTRLTLQNILPLLSESHAVIDATDCVHTKFLINDFCAGQKIPYCYGGVVGMAGQLLFAPHTENSRVACLRCLFGDFRQSDYTTQTTTCEHAGILGAVAGHIGNLQAHEILYYFAQTAPIPSATILKRASMANPSPRETLLPPAADCPLGCALRGVLTLDLTDKTCPATFLYTKLALEKAAPRTIFDVRLSSEESVSNVWRNCQELDFHLYSKPLQISESLWRILVSQGKSDNA